MNEIHWYQSLDVRKDIRKKKLQQALKDNDMTYQQLADQVDISYYTIKAIVFGYSAGNKHVKKICNILNLEIVDERDNNNA